MTAVLVTVHLLAAGIWFGGSTALVFVGVPAIRTVEGEQRGRAMKKNGLRWRPIGYGALLVAAVTGIVLAARDWQSTTSFKVVLAVKAAVVHGAPRRLLPAQLRLRPTTCKPKPARAAISRRGRRSSSSGGSATR